MAAASSIPRVSVEWSMPSITPTRPGWFFSPRMHASPRWRLSMGRCSYASVAEVEELLAHDGHVGLFGRRAPRRRRPSRGRGRVAATCEKTVRPRRKRWTPRAGPSTRARPARRPARDDLEAFFEPQQRAGAGQLTLGENADDLSGLEAFGGSAQGVLRAVGRDGDGPEQAQDRD